jgi:hypothetical protein
MPDLPMAMMTVIGAFAPLFSRRIFAYVMLLLVGAILAQSQRTVTAVLRVMGKSAEAHFQNYYRVVSRAQWSSLEASRPGVGAAVHDRARPLGTVLPAPRASAAIAAGSGAADGAAGAALVADQRACDGGR